jgi:hypothetical protein
MSASVATQNITTASQQWATRPDDQRFLTMAELKASVSKRRQESWTATPLINNLRTVTTTNGKMAVEVYDPTVSERRLLEPTNWAFNQLSQYAGAPAAYLRKLPTELAAINLQWGLEHSPMRDDSLVLAQSNGKHELRSMTSTSYGRIWDIDVVNAVEKVNHNGRWQVPSSSYTTSNPRRATTLYASDRDVFIFLVDPKNPVQVGDETLFRGFYTWNSEVGSSVFGLCTFLYRYVCDNRIIWGATNVKELRIRHTGGAPERFAYEGQKYLMNYAEESTQELVAGIKQAKSMDIASSLNDGNGETMATWLQKRGFTKTEAKASVDQAVAEEGRARSLWDIVNGVTAYARTIQNTDSRVDLEQRAGKLMDLVK